MLDINVSLDLHFDEWQKEFEKELTERLGKAAQHLVRELKSTVSKGYSPPPSRPGEPPHVDTGELRDSIDWQFSGPDSIRITEAAHGDLLEFGTAKMAARPWLRPTLEAEKEAMIDILAEK